MDTQTKTRRSALKRFNRKPKTHARGTDMQLAVLEHLFDYRYSATPYIKAAVGSPEYVEDILPDMVELGYIGVPPFAVDRCKTRAIPHLYELKDRAAEFYENKRGKRLRNRAGNWPEHDFLTCALKFSYELAPRVIPGLSLRTSEAIRAHENYPPGMKDHPSPFVIPTSPTLEYDLPPFGFEFEGRKIFALHETDNNTHSLKDIKSKIDRSCEFLERKMAVTMYGIPTRLFNFFFVTRSKRRMDDMLELVPDEHASRFHFKWTGGFDDKLPPATAHMVLEPWHQKDGSMWSILEHLGADDVRREESSPRQGIGAGD